MAGSTSSCTKTQIWLAGLLGFLSLAPVSLVFAQPETLPSKPIAPPHARVGAPDYVTTMRNHQGVRVVVGKGFNISQLAGTAPVGPGPTEADLAPPTRHYTRGVVRPIDRAHTGMQQLAGQLIPSAATRSATRSDGLNAFKTNQPLTPQQQALERELTAKFRPYQQLTPQDILKPMFQKRK